MDNLKVLVVDDMRVMRNIIKKNLTVLGINKIDEADDGVTAWQMLLDSKKENDPYHLIISDWNMPNMNGQALLTKVRLDTEYKEIPFVMVTAEGERKVIVNAIQSGVSNFIVKPFTSETFVDKICKVLK
ncbi:MAG: response regulator [Bacteriovoracaceae bacterium]|jgi:two-component system chemotaxis response regulator CheY|nr:response regulator [Bacteriovoracaceae bacterium]